MKSQIRLCLTQDLHISHSNIQFLIRCVQSSYLWTYVLCILLHVLRQSYIYNDYYLTFSLVACLCLCATFLCFSFYYVQQREIKTDCRVTSFLSDFSPMALCILPLSSPVPKSQYKTHCTIRRNSILSQEATVRQGGTGETTAQIGRESDPHGLLMVQVQKERARAAETSSLYLFSVVPSSKLPILRKVQM